MKDLLGVTAQTREELWALASQGYVEVFGRPPVAFDPAWQVEFLREYHSGVPDERTPELVRAVHGEIAARWPWLAVEAQRQERAFVRSLASRLETDMSWLTEALDEEPGLARCESGWEVEGRSATVDVVAEALCWQLYGRTAKTEASLPWPESQTTVVDSIAVHRHSVCCVTVPVHGSGLQAIGLAKGFATSMLDVIEEHLGWHEDHLGDICSDGLLPRTTQEQS